MNRLGSALTDLAEALGKAAPALEARCKEGCAKLQEAASKGMALARQPDKLGERLDAAGQDLLGAAELAAAGLRSAAEAVAAAASPSPSGSKESDLLAGIERLKTQLGQLEQRVRTLEAGQAQPPNQKDE